MIIPCHVLNESLEVCLHSLEPYTAYFDELILVFDGVATDPSFVGHFQFPHLRVERIPERSGPAHARNVGASAARSDLLFFLDSDVEVVTNIFDQARFFIQDEAAPAAIIGSYDHAPADQSTISRFRNLMHHYVHQESQVNISSFWGACGIIRADVFHEMGGFDETFRQASVEDIELGYRLSQNGYSIQLRREMQVKHLKKWTFANILKTDICFRARPWTRLLIKYQSLPDKNLSVSPREKWVTLFMSLTFASLLISLFNPIFMAAFLAFGSLSITLKYPFYRFMTDHMAKRKMPLIILLHWTYYLSAIVGFILGGIDHLRFPGHDRPTSDALTIHQSPDR